MGGGWSETGTERPQTETGESVTTAGPAAEDEAAEEPQRKKIAITFDDGPHPHYTEELLDGLKERDVKATFFLVGKNIEGNEEIVRRIYDEGHLLGNHTYDHVDVGELSEAQICEQVEQTNELIYHIVGEYPGYLRPPFGSWNDQVECAQDMMLVMWTIDSRDWTTTSLDDIITKVVKEAEENGVILMHDWYQHSVKAALVIIDILQSQGYEFVTVDEILFD